MPNLFYLLFQRVASRTGIRQNLNDNGILAVFHYQSLTPLRFNAQKHFPAQYSRDLP